MQVAIEVSNELRWQLKALNLSKKRKSSVIDKPALQLLVSTVSIKSDSEVDSCICQLKKKVKRSFRRLGLKPGTKLTKSMVETAFR